MKKTMASITAMLLAALSVPMSITSAEGGIKGDVDMDGVITGHDAAIVSQYADGILKIDLSEEQLALADMNGDGVVDASDAALISENQKYALCDMNEDGIIDIVDGRDVLRMAFLRKIDPEMYFGINGIRADIDCNGVIDVYDAHCIIEYYATSFRKDPVFEDGKYYFLVTPEIEQERLELDPYVELHPEANIQTLQELYDLKWNANDYLDIDGDNEVTFSDANAVLQVYAGRMAGIYEAPADDKADVNGDGAIDFYDSRIILKYYAMDMAGLL